MAIEQHEQSPPYADANARHEVAAFMRELLGEDQGPGEDQPAPEQDDENQPALAAAGEDENLSQADDDAPEEEPGDGEGDTEQTDEEQEVAAGGDTLNDLWKASGYKAEDLYSLGLRLQGGEVVPLGKLKDEVQEARNMRRQMDEERARFETEKTQAQQAVQTAMMQSRAAIPPEAKEAQSTIDQLVQIYRTVNWEEVEKKDPGKAALAKQKMEERYQAAQGVYEKSMREHQAKQAEVFASYLAEQRQQAINKHPAWADAATFKTDMATMQETLKPYGYTPRDFDLITDHRIFLVLRRLAELEGTLQAGATAIRKGPKPRLRVLKSGNAGTPGQGRKKRRQALEQKVAEKGSTRQKAALIGQIITGAD